jgi:hypothetical protein
MQKTGFFSDLDNTLIFSARHLKPGLPELIALEHYGDGRIGGYLTVKAHELLTDISHRITFIPVTARHDVEYNRLAFGAFNINHAVLGNGSIIMQDGERMASWDSHINALRNQGSTAALSAIELAIEQQLTSRRMEYALTVIEDLFCVYAMDAQAIPADLMPTLLPLAESMGYRLSLQHRKLHVVPLWLSKGRAMMTLAEELNLTTRYAAGDAVLDAPMVTAADIGWVPAGAEIAEQMQKVPQVRITNNASILAGEEILAAVAAQL